jgi:RimJ/RimL family protein N-acetyltransferase
MRLLGNNDPPADLGLLVVALRGRHIRLEPLTIHHADGIQPWVDADEPGLYNSLASPVDFDGSAARFFAWLIERAGTRILPFAVVRNDTDEVVGYTRYLHIEPGLRSLHVGGTWYAPPARGTVVNPECKLLMLRHALVDGRFNRVQLQTDVANERSQRAIARIGATFEGIGRADHPRRDGTVRDTWIASIIRTDWPEVERRLIALIESSAPLPAVKD